MLTTELLMPEQHRRIQLNIHVFCIRVQLWYKLHLNFHHKRKNCFLLSPSFINLLWTT